LKRGTLSVQKIAKNAKILQNEKITGHKKTLDLQGF
jgi:hypothetical protein